MDKERLIVGLRGLADVLLPFAQSHAASARVWNGSEYVTTEVKQADPYALMWYSKLKALAAILTAQETELSPAQIEYLRQTIFGGVGSLADFYIDTNAYGNSAKIANDELNRRRTQLFALFE